MTKLRGRHKMRRAFVAAEAEASIKKWRVARRFFYFASIFLRLFGEGENFSPPRKIYTVRALMQTRQTQAMPCPPAAP
jgi:hypothetical protein